MSNLRRGRFAERVVPPPGDGQKRRTTSFELRRVRLAVARGAPSSRTVSSPVSFLFSFRGEPHAHGRRRGVPRPERGEVQMRLGREPDRAALANLLPSSHDVADGDDGALCGDVHVLHVQLASLVVFFFFRVHLEHDAVPPEQVRGGDARDRLLVPHVYDRRVGDGEHRCSHRAPEIHRVRVPGEEVRQSAVLALRAEIRAFVW
mmetsp:Transcript_10906/g.45823  ORF Transcript_10906/g.45823 Transcript_10906/m.45823 type:complete len:204 (+) Transcript_10906:725-1336(+)